MSTENSNPSQIHCKFYQFRLYASHVVVWFRYKTNAHIVILLHHLVGTDLVFEPHHHYKIPRGTH